MESVLPAEVPYPARCLRCRQTPGLPDQWSYSNEGCNQVFFQLPEHNLYPDFWR